MALKKQGTNKNLLILGAIILVVLAAIMAYGYSASKKNKEMAEKAAAYSAIKDAKAKAAEVENKAREEERQARLEKQAQQWGKPTPEQLALDADKKKEGERRGRFIEIGMTEGEVKELYSWGIPDHINTTTTNNGQSQQWVYKGNRFLYFSDGKLTAIQN